MLICFASNLNSIKTILLTDLGMHFDKSEKIDSSKRFLKTIVLIVSEFERYFERYGIQDLFELSIAVITNFWIVSIRGRHSKISWNIFVSDLIEDMLNVWEYNANLVVHNSLW